ncbi:MAG: zinc-ribbon domain-containing protein [Clostridia bacterium]|nr:zinc-ribbon domain-containing protein [Clostridia bacterium]
MKYCIKCGNELNDDARFCVSCGTAVVQEAAPEVETYVANEDAVLIQEEKECLDNFYRFFKYERLAWKISGIVFLILSIVFMGFGLLFALLAAVVEEAFAAGFGAIYILYGLLILPVAIVNLKMVSKAEYYMDIIYKDARPVVKRCSSVGMIVLGAMFNTIAMAFIIVNFVLAKTKAPILQRVVERQQAANK